MVNKKYLVNLYFYGIHICNNQIGYADSTQAVTLTTTMVMDVSAKVETNSQFYIRGFAILTLGSVAIVYSSIYAFSEGNLLHTIFLDLIVAIGGY